MRFHYKIGVRTSSSKQVVDNLAFDICQSIVASGVTVGKSFVV